MKISYILIGTLLISGCSKSGQMGEQQYEDYKINFLQESSNYNEKLDEAIKDSDKNEVQKQICNLYKLHSKNLKISETNINYPDAFESLDMSKLLLEQFEAEEAFDLEKFKDANDCNDLSPVEENNYSDNVEEYNYSDNETLAIKYEEHRKKFYDMDAIIQNKYIEIDGEFVENPLKEEDYVYRMASCEALTHLLALAEMRELHPEFYSHYEDLGYKEGQEYIDIELGITSMTRQYYAAKGLDPKCAALNDPKILDYYIDTE